MNITFRLAWRNLWRRKRRTWLTVGAMVFSNIILVFMDVFRNLFAGRDFDQHTGDVQCMLF